MEPSWTSGGGTPREGLYIAPEGVFALPLIITGANPILKNEFEKI